MFRGDRLTLAQPSQRLRLVLACAPNQLLGEREYLRIKGGGGGSGISGHWSASGEEEIPQGIVCCGSLRSSSSASESTQISPSAFVLEVAGHCLSSHFF